MAENCKLLSSVDLQGCRQVTDKGGNALAENCESLSTVYLQGFPQVTAGMMQTLKARRLQLFIVGFLFRTSSEGFHMYIRPQQKVGGLAG